MSLCAWLVGVCLCVCVRWEMGISSGVVCIAALNPKRSHTKQQRPQSPGPGRADERGRGRAQRAIDSQLRAGQIDVPGIPKRRETLEKGVGGRDGGHSLSLSLTSTEENDLCFLRAGRILFGLHAYE